MAEIGPLFEEMTAAITEQNAAIASLEKKVGQQNDKLTEFVPRGRFRYITAGLLVGGLMVLALVFGFRAERQFDSRQEQVRSVARAYANCETANRILAGEDERTMAIRRVLDGLAATPQALERTDRIVNALRVGLNRTDCSGHLEDLSVADAEKVRNEASRTLPTLPLPPPPPR